MHTDDAEDVENAPASTISPVPDESTERDVLTRVIKTWQTVAVL